jgi:hypothetical protein
MPPKELRLCYGRVLGEGGSWPKVGCLERDGGESVAESRIRGAMPKISAKGRKCGEEWKLEWLYVF